MFFPEKMYRFKIEIPEEHLDEELENIGKTGVLHIECKKKMTEFFELEKRVEELLKLSESYLDILGIKKRKRFKGYIKNSTEELNKLESEISEIKKDIDEVSNRIKSLKREREVLSLAKNIKESLRESVDLEKLSKKLKFIKFKTGIVSEDVIEVLIVSLRIYRPFIVYKKISTGSYALAVFFTEKIEEHVNASFKTLQVREIYKEYFLTETEKRIDRELKRIEEKKKNLRRIYGDNLISINSRLRFLKSLFMAKVPLQKKDNSYILCGWVPSRYLNRLIKSLKWSKYEYEEAKDYAPVLIKTPKLFKPFERLVKEFSYPRYNEINPVVPFAVTFLLMFGVMFGDVGHGTVLSAIGYFLSKKEGKISDYGKILMMSGFSSVIFGFLYGAVFGFHIISTGFVHPLHDTKMLLISGIVIGILIISLSFLLNIITLYKRRSFLSLLLGEGGILGLLIYWYTIGVLAQYLVFHTDIKNDLIILLILILIQLIYIVYKRKEVSGSIFDVFREFLETITNTVSFIRLGAFALAHSTLFIAIFTIAKMLRELQGGEFLYWVVVALGNVIIILFEGLIVSIQALRLEYYEFFKRFYRGGGEPYRPYRLETVKS